MSENVNVFEYLGKRFVPIRQFKGKKENDFSRDLRTDSKLGFSNYDWNKAFYNYKDFYKESGDSKCDLFKCLDNGKIYVPCGNELFEYVDRSIKSLKYQTLVNKVEKIKELLLTNEIKCGYIDPSKLQSFEDEIECTLLYLENLVVSLLPNGSFKYSVRSMDIEDNVMTEYTKIRSLEGSILEILNEPYTSIEV